MTDDRHDPFACGCPLSDDEVNAILGIERRRRLPGDEHPLELLDAVMDAEGILTLNEFRHRHGGRIPPADRLRKLIDKRAG